ncbi:alpha/beta fold hydrolase [Pacificimonas sp. WHA3]|uniref:Alpha/beta fold hydrolase n=1 Tax=Pacificimonas pallii TaxID=2827236 RepID=A0ABS6SAU1_9SPHN|nr:alpha/beta hydrolase [Pacificimonas pallii]MBV7255533.1 alpha/beta fold hydrolase [Pacificimonas pallii]
MTVTLSPRTERRKVEPPPLSQYLMEVRAVGEFARFLMSDRTHELPRGDGHGVIVYPGFMAADTTTFLLRRRLAKLNYDVYGWGQGQNLGLRAGMLPEMRRHLKAVAAKSGGRVSMIGWSLGGLYAREVAKLEPDHVRLVVTAGTPCVGDMRGNNAWKLYERLNDHWVNSPPLPTDLETLPPVPLTSIYSDGDGIVAPECTKIGNGDMHESVRVDSSHVGLAWSHEVLAVTANRLAQPAGSWAPYSG